MLKKYIALALALVLLLSVTACGGKEDKEPNKDSSTTVTTTTTEGVTDGTTTAVDHNCTTTATDTTGSTVTTTTKKPTTTTAYVPDGVTVPIGTRPATTTTSGKTTTTTTVAGGSTADGTTTAPTTTTTTVAKPTDPPAPQRYVALPAVGTDIDVTKKRDRIRVSAAYAWFNEDGTIGVSLTFTNYTTNWITEETDYVQYTCYDENGKVVQKATKIALGVIDTKKNKSKTFEFNVPADTAEVRLTKSKIVYWTEWS